MVIVLSMARSASTSPCATWPSHWRADRAIWFTYNFSYDMSYYCTRSCHARWRVHPLARAARPRRHLLPELAGEGPGCGRPLLYLFAFFPGIIALISVARRGGASWAIQERSFTSKRRPALSTQDGDPDRGDAHGDPGRGRDHPIFHRLPHRCVAPALSDVRRRRQSRRQSEV